MSQDCLRIIPLGGIGQIGKNMMVFEYDDQLMIVDCGLMFPESDMLGIDVVIPDMNYVFERKDRVRAIVVTHGHEDHVGGLPYLMQQVKAPLYATRLTRGLIEVKLREHHLLDGAELHTVTPEDVLDLRSLQGRLLSRLPFHPGWGGIGHHNAGGSSRPFRRL